MIYIGTSGWSYGDWSDGCFYPSDISNRQWLEFYSRSFDTVEINATFYHQMRAKTFANWREQTPKNFVFSVKMSRYLTHIKKLNDPEEPWQRFIDNAGGLKRKLGPILVQLPPNFHFNKDKLKKLMKTIPAKYRIALEARHESWFDPQALDILRKHNAALVFSYGEGIPLDETMTADWLYMRMHGPAGLYDSRYRPGHLKNLADKIRGWRRKAKDIYVYFNNDTKGYAAENARGLKELL